MKFIYSYNFLGENHKFEEAEILENSKDFPSHSGIQTPTLNAAIGRPKGKKNKEWKKKLYLNL